MGGGGAESSSYIANKGGSVDPKDLGLDLPAIDDEGRYVDIDMEDKGRQSAGDHSRYDVEEI